MRLASSILILNSTYDAYPENKKRSWLGTNGLRYLNVMSVCLKFFKTYSLYRHLIVRIRSRTDHARLSP